MYSAWISQILREKCDSLVRERLLFTTMRVVFEELAGKLFSLEIQTIEIRIKTKTNRSKENKCLLDGKRKFWCDTNNTNYLVIIHLLQHCQPISQRSQKRFDSGINGVWVICELWDASLRVANFQYHIIFGQKCLRVHFDIPSQDDKNKQMCSLWGFEAT